MKTLVCEMCGGNNLLKQEGVYVCQNCKTQYSVEEAKKMMIEGTVDVSGSTVKVDNTSKLDNLYKIARRAWADGNADQAYKRYEELLAEDPDNWEPNFYTAFFQGLNYLKNDKPGGSVQVRGGSVNLSLEYRSGISPCISRIHNCLDSVFSLIEDIKDYDIQKAAADSVYENVLYAERQLKSVVEAEHSRMRDEIVHYNRETEASASGMARSITGKGPHATNDKNRASYRRDIDAMVSLTENRIKRLEEVVGKRRFDEYWTAHQDDKKALESEKQSLQGQIAKLNNDIQAVPGYTEMVYYQQQIQQEKDNAMSSVPKPKTAFLTLGIILGIAWSIICLVTGTFISIIFGVIVIVVCIIVRSNMTSSFKAQQSNVDAHFQTKFQSLYQNYTSVTSNVEAINQNIAPLQDRVSAIDTELTKPR